MFQAMACWTSRLYRRWDVSYVHNCTQGRLIRVTATSILLEVQNVYGVSARLERAGSPAPSRFRSAARHLGNRRRQRHSVGSGWFDASSENRNQLKVG
jgi:hypothetical protein